MTEPSIAFPDGPEDLRPGDDAIVGFLARATPQEPRHSEADIVALPGGCSPCTLRRLPGSDDVLAIWTPGHHQRTPLAAAVSGDGGHTWHNAKLLERSLYHGYCYASCTFVGERTVLSYMHYPIVEELRRFHSKPHYHELRFVSLPTTWFTR